MPGDPLEMLKMLLDLSELFEITLMSFLICFAPVDLGSC